MGQKKFHYRGVFKLESGETLRGLDINYTTYGTLNKAKDNVIWIVHALTGNSDPLQWWGGIAGKGRLFDPDKYFIVCSNNLGSCYGTTGPSSINPRTKKRYGKNFPSITIRDMVQANILLRKKLGIKNIFIITGGSLGGQVSLEWAVTEPDMFRYLIPIAANAKHSAWGIAFNETQRMALEGGENGLSVARAIALLSYRSYSIYDKTQSDTDERLDGFSASSYQRYQGVKLKNRFDKYSYFVLSKAMDSHNIARGRGSIYAVLRGIKTKTLVIGIKSDILFPVIEQKLLAGKIPGAKIKIINSVYGHDGFLVEYNKISKAIQSFLLNDINNSKGAGHVRKK